MTSRQAKKNRKLRLENERLREMQKTRLEVGFELGKMEKKIDQVYEKYVEVSRNQHLQLARQSTILEQQDYLKAYVKQLEAETRKEKELVLDMRKDIRELYQTKEMKKPPKRLLQIIGKYLLFDFTLIIVGVLLLNRLIEWLLS